MQIEITALDITLLIAATKLAPMTHGDIKRAAALRAVFEEQAGETLRAANVQIEETRFSLDASEAERTAAVSLGEEEVQFLHQAFQMALWPPRSTLITEGVLALGEKLVGWIAQAKAEALAAQMTPMQRKRLARELSKGAKGAL